MVFADIANFILNEGLSPNGKWLFADFNIPKKGMMRPLSKIIIRILYFFFNIATKLGVELRNQYVIGYRTTNRTRDGHWRKVKVKLLPPKGLPHLNVYSKTGYYAPSQ